MIDLSKRNASTPLAESYIDSERKMFLGSVNGNVVVYSVVISHHSALLKIIENRIKNYEN